MDRKKILYIESNTDGTIGGSHYSLLYLLEGLNRKLYEPHVLFCQNNIMIPKFKELVESVTVYNYSPSGSNPFKTWKVIPRFLKHIVFKQPALNKIIKSIRPDLVHLNNTYAANHEWMLACSLNKIKIVAHDRGTMPPSTWQTRFFVKYLDAIISVSDAYTRFVIEQGLKPKRIRRIYNGLDIDKFRKYCSQDERYRLREELGIAYDTILVGMVGNIDYWKGQFVFAMAMDELIREVGENVHVKGMIIGNTPRGAEAYEQEIRDFLKDRKIDDRVRLLGFRQDIPQLLNAMDVFVHASVKPEPFGRVILEAMAMEKPIIATKPGGPCEILDEGATGYLIPMNDPIAMKVAIMRYVREPAKAKEMGIAARQAAEMRFSVFQMVQGVEKVYEEIFGPIKTEC
jgi:glycosyltransferase involved in cell wall biosynthesis